VLYVDDHNHEVKDPDHHGDAHAHTDHDHDHSSVAAEADHHTPITVHMLKPVISR